MSGHLSEEVDPVDYRETLVRSIVASGVNRAAAEETADDILGTSLGGKASTLTLTEDQWADLAAIARSYVALYREGITAPGRYTDLDRATQKRRHDFAQRLIEAAGEAEHSGSNIAESAQ